MQRSPVDGTYIFLSKKIRLFGSIDYWPSTEMYFVAIGLLERAKRMSWCRVSTSTIITI